MAAGPVTCEVTPSGSPWAAFSRSDVTPTSRSLAPTPCTVTGTKTAVPSSLGIAGTRELPDSSAAFFCSTPAACGLSLSSLLNSTMACEVFLSGRRSWMATRSADWLPRGRESVPARDRSASCTVPSMTSAMTISARDTSWRRLRRAQGWVGCVWSAGAVLLMGGLTSGKINI